MAQDERTGGGAGAFPIGVLTVTLLLTLGLFFGLSWFAWRTHQDFQALKTRDLPLEMLDTAIGQDNETLTMSARLALETGEAGWSERYVESESALSDALAELLVLAPGLVPAETIDGLRDSSASLRARERQAMDLEASGDHAGALAAITGEDYAALRTAYTAREEELVAAIQDHLDTTLDSQHARQKTIMVALGLVIPLVTAAWLYSLLLMRRFITGRRQAEESLRARTRQLEESQHVARLGSWDWDIAADRLTWSDELYHIFGVEPQGFEATYQAFLDMVHPDDRAMLDRAVRKSVADCSHYHVDARIMRPDGTQWVMEAIGEVYTDEQGKPARMSGTAQDITERKRIEKLVISIATGVSAETGESFFRSLVERLAAALDADFAFIGRLAGEEPPRVRTIETYAHGEKVDDFEYELAGTPCETVIGKELCAYPSGVQERFPEDQMLVDMGIEGYVGTPLADSAGSPLGIMAVLFHQPIKNLTLCESLLKIFASRASAEMEREEAEAARRASEERYRTLFEESRDAIYMASSEGRFIEVNPAGVEMLGYTREELLELDLAHDLYADPADRDAYQRILAEKGFVEDYEITLRRKDGSPLLFSVTANIIRDSEGNITGNWGIGRDITEHRRMEQQLLQAQKMESIGRLAGGVAHDFNNLLTAIKGYTDLAILELPPDSPALENIYEVSKSTERAIAVTRQLLFFSRREQLNLKIVDANAVVRDMKRMLDRLIGERHRIVTDLAEDLESLFADPGHLEQVVVNLVINARDAMPAGGDIILRTGNVTLDGDRIPPEAGSEPGDYIRLTVSDSGVGMDEETVRHIFEPFYSTKETGQGTGLGLSVAYGIAEQHGGWIDVLSAPGQGSTFRVFLPVVPYEPVRQPREQPVVEDLGGHGEKVLVVEDEEGVRLLLEKMLTRSGYRVLAAADAGKGLELYRKENGAIDLVFSDVVLPGENGLQLVERLLADDPSLPVLLASGYHEDEYRRVIEEKGYRFLQKPYSLPEVMAAVRDLLSMKEA